jgi:hypothetical protein
MADYRAVVRHVRYWRGNVHRWSNSFEFTGSGTTPNAAACNILTSATSEMCYAATSAAQGGIFETAIYRAGGGVPLATVTYFDDAVPADWIKYTATGWGGDGSSAVDPSAEVAMICTWPAGLSATGKPVTFRKWFHAVPVSSTSNGGVDIASGVVSTLQTAALALQTCLAPTYGLALGNSGRLAATTPVVSGFYGNHQMPKGRRKKSVTVDGTSYKIKSTPGIVADGPIESD